MSINRPFPGSLGGRIPPSQDTVCKPLTGLFLQPLLRGKAPRERDVATTVSQRAEPKMARHLASTILIPLPTRHCRSFVPRSDHHVPKAVRGKLFPQSDRKGPHQRLQARRYCSTARTSVSSWGSRTPGATARFRTACWRLTTSSRVALVVNTKSSTCNCRASSATRSRRADSGFLGR